MILVWSFAFFVSSLGLSVMAYTVLLFMRWYATLPPVITRQADAPQVSASSDDRGGKTIQATHPPMYESKPKGGVITSEPTILSDARRRGEIK
jgi:hypothetical protein